MKSVNAQLEPRILTAPRPPSKAPSRAVGLGKKAGLGVTGDDVVIISIVGASMVLLSALPAAGIGAGIGAIAAPKGKGTTWAGKGALIGGGIGAVGGLVTFLIMAATPSPAP